VPLPFLLAFAETIPSEGDTAPTQLGTETFTKAIEGSDTDALAVSEPGALEGFRAGTATHSASSEEQDVDRDPPPELALGTETYTDVRAEQTDSDEPRRGGTLWEASLL
jgi:hypothetical protein